MSRKLYIFYSIYLAVYIAAILAVIIVIIFDVTAFFVCPLTTHTCLFFYLFLSFPLYLWIFSVTHAIYRAKVLLFCYCCFMLLLPAIKLLYYVTLRLMSFVHLYEYVWCFPFHSSIPIPYHKTIMYIIFRLFCLYACKQ